MIWRRMAASAPSAVVPDEAPCPSRDLPPPSCSPASEYSPGGLDGREPGQEFGEALLWVLEIHQGFVNEGQTGTTASSLMPSAAMWWVIPVDGPSHALSMRGAKR